MKSTFLLLVIIVCGVTCPVNLWCQLDGVAIIAGGELTTHRLVSPFDAGGLEFEFEFGQTEAEPEQSFFGGIRADWIIKGQLGLQSQVDYGSVIYNVFFREPSEVVGVFGPATRGVFYAPDRLDLSVLPTYTFDLGKFAIIPKFGITYSLPIGEDEYIDKVADRVSQQKAVAIENALNRSFGRGTWKLNAGIDITFGRLFAHFNIRHQLDSASDVLVKVEGIEESIPFDNRLTALQFGLGYRVIQF